MTGRAEADELDVARARFQAGFDAGDLDALAALLTDDVIWRPAGQPPWVGRDEVLDRMGGFFERFRYRFRLQDTRIEGDARRAVELSNFVSEVVDPGQESGQAGPPHTGSVVIVWANDTGWRIAAYLDLGPTCFPAVA